MNINADMRITFIDPDERALYAAEHPDGGFAVFSQKGTNAPRKLINTYITIDCYPTLEEAQDALCNYISNQMSNGPHRRWDILVNGKNVTTSDYYAMRRGELPAPISTMAAAPVTLANIEFRISQHMQDVYGGLLGIGHCLNEAKESGLVPHGKWEDWVRHNTGMGERQAQKLMQAARSIPAGSAMEKLPISKIQVLLSLPEPEREPMAERAQNEDMSLRKLREEVAREKARANKAEMLTESYKEAQQKSEQRAVEAEKRALDAERIAEEKAEKLREELEAALNNADHAFEGLASIGPEAQAEIDRLTEALADAEADAERQAELRQEAQQKLLNQQAQNARGEMPAADGLSAFDLAAAIRTFIGSVGVLPHMGTTVASMSNTERQEISRHLDMVDTWLAGSRAAMDIVVIDAE